MKTSRPSAIALFAIKTKIQAGTAPREVAKK